MRVLVVVVDIVDGQIGMGEKGVDKDRRSGKGKSCCHRSEAMGSCRELEVGLSHCDVTDTSRWDIRGQKKG